MDLWKEIKRGNGKEKHLKTITTKVLGTVKEQLPQHCSRIMIGSLQAGPNHLSAERDAFIAPHLQKDLERFGTS